MPSCLSRADSALLSAQQRIGYLCASQSFYENTDVIMLTTNMIRKDLNSCNMYDAGCAMSGIACFVTEDLSRDLAMDIMSLLNHTKPYLRKKAVLLMYKVLLKHPEALKPVFPRLKEKLEDPDPGVQSAAVNVICELARKNPRNYLALAPTFFKLMTNSTNNWMLIKIIKLVSLACAPPALLRLCPRPPVSLPCHASMQDCVPSLDLLLLLLPVTAVRSPDSIRAPIGRQVEPSTDRDHQKVTLSRQRMPSLLQQSSLTHFLALLFACESHCMCMCTTGVADPLH